MKKELIRWEYLVNQMNVISICEVSGMNMNLAT